MHLKGPAKILKNWLRNYKGIHDIIIFGSVVKEKMNPADMDIAIIMDSKDPVLIGEMQKTIPLKNIHLQIFSYVDFLKSTLPYCMLSEGYSIKDGRFISDKLGVSRKSLYTFSLDALSQIQKVMFNKGLRTLIQSTKAEKVGKGAVLVPVRVSGEYDDFFRQWNRKVKKKEFLEMNY